MLVRMERKTGLPIKFRQIVYNLWFFLLGMLAGIQKWFTAIEKIRGSSEKHGKIWALY